ncbi:MAG: DMT family transporter [Acidimicrobiales bacterium]
MRRAVAQAWIGEGHLTYRQGAVLIAGAGVVFSFTVLLFRGTENATDWQFLTLRSAGVALAMLLLTWLRRRGRPVDFSVVGPSTFIAGLLMAAMSMLYVLALARTTAAMTVGFIAAGPFCGALFGWLLLRERVGRRTWVAMAVAAVGIGVIVSAGLGGGAATGMLLAAMIPVLLGLYNVLIRSTPGVDPVIPALIGGVTATLVAATAAVIETGLSMSTRDAFLAGAAGFVLLGIGLPLFNLGHRYVPTAQVSLLIMTELVLAPLWVWIWPGETPEPTTLLGGAIVIGAVVWQITGAQEDGGHEVTSPPTAVSR